ncbi:hypothetical protein BDP27DRAFT_1333875 [Rhodocollybia butyracea]|uniref:Uncharacterized protein n=1 Tax=Rhodocollybia butyracea TaxID=206335 RepID=A0A9P5PFC5_9AGAR|nr:hypothetical protein BDP27DRAFT_1333875 [Rhodocollybia butyracea]
MISTFKRILGLVSACALFSLSIHAQPIRTSRVTPHPPVSEVHENVLLKIYPILRNEAAEYIGLPMDASKYVLFHPRLTKKTSKGAVIDEQHAWTISLSDFSKLIKKADVKYINHLMREITRKQNRPTKMQRFKDKFRVKPVVSEITDTFSDIRDNKLDKTILVDGLKRGSYTTRTMFVPKALVKEKLKNAEILVKENTKPLEKPLLPSIGPSMAQSLPGNP